MIAAALVAALALAPQAPPETWIIPDPEWLGVELGWPGLIPPVEVELREGEDLAFVGIGRFEPFAFLPMCREGAVPPSLVVLGLENRLEGRDARSWRDQRLAVGLRGRLVEIYADSGAFTLLEEKDLAGSIQEALGGYWLREKSAGELADLEGVHRSTGARWIAYGSLDRMGVTRAEVTGLVGKRSWKYRSEVRLCLHEAGGGEVCEEGSGESRTTVRTFGVEMRGEDVAFDQAGPAEAVDHALIDAFNRLMPRWERRGRPGR